jgi:hypothetical protein
MKHPYLLIFLTLICIHPFASLSQPSQAAAHAVLQEGLSTYLQGVEAFRECLRSNCKHDFSGEFKVLRTGESRKAVEYWFEDRYTYHGVARVVQRCYYEAPQATVRFYAEMSFEDGTPRLTLLRWRQGDCMSYETLFEAGEAAETPALLPE